MPHDRAAIERGVGGRDTSHEVPRAVPLGEEVDHAGPGVLDETLDVCAPTRHKLWANQLHPYRTMRKEMKVTAKELIEQLENDPAFVARRAERYAEYTSRLRKTIIEQQPLVSEIQSAGFQIKVVSDLLKLRTRYVDIIPILLKHLHFEYSAKTKEFIARALARPWARKEAWEFVLEAYRREPNETSGTFKSGLAVALSSMVRPSDLQTVMELVGDTRNGSTRIFFVRNLSRSRREEAHRTLERLADDPDLRKEIAHTLKRKRRLHRPIN